MALKVDVKWQKELLKDVEIDTEQPPLVFKSQLFTLTGAADAHRRPTACHRPERLLTPISLPAPPALMSASITIRFNADAGVAPDRQKIMVKGGMLKDDADWAKLGIKPGQKLMMMGSAGERTIRARHPDANHLTPAQILGSHAQTQRTVPLASQLDAVSAWAEPQSSNAWRKQAAAGARQ